MTAAAQRISSRLLAQPITIATLLTSFSTSAFIRNSIQRPTQRFVSESKIMSSPKDEGSLHLIDVDCNLLHSDLKSAMSSISTLQTIPDVREPFQILHHPSTKLSNIIAMISPSSTVDESETSVALLQSSTAIERNSIQVKTTVGVHPYHCLNSPTAPELNRLCALLDGADIKQYISCIGETGLDYSDGFPSKECQLPWFRAHLDLAFEYNMPLFLHERLAFEDTLQCIDEAVERHEDKAIPKIIIHCYTGSFDECVEYMKRGYYISLSGYIMKEGDANDQVRKCLREGIIPIDRLMIETDSPYMGFVGNKDTFYDAEGDSFNSLSSKKRKRLKSMYPNVPCSLPLVLKATLHEINVGRENRGECSMSLEELAAATTRNAQKFFRL